MKNKFTYLDFHRKEHQISLITKKLDKKENHYSIIIGENGTGKSELLKAIAIDEMGKNRLICLPFSYHDKFHPEIDEFKILSDGIKHERRALDATYFYLGARNKNKQFSTNAYAKRILAILAAQDLRDNINKIKGIYELFNCLGFRPEISFRFRFVKNDFFKSIISGKSFKQSLSVFLKSKSNSIFSKNLIENIERALGDSELLEALENKIGRVINGTSLVKQTVTQFINFDHNNTSSEVLNDVIAPMFLLEMFGVTKFLDISLFKKESASTLSIESISSGEFKRLVSFMSLIAVAENHSTIIIDEPEISSHPAWQCEFVSQLKSFLKFTNNCHFIIATHSPYILSSIDNLQTTIVAAKNIKDEHVYTSYQGQSSGWSVEKILLDVFGVATVRNLYFDNKVAELIEHLSNDKSKIDQLRLKSIVSYFNDFQIDSVDPLYDLLIQAKSDLGIQVD